MPIGQAFGSYLSAVIAAVCFGVQYVPVKGYETYDGAIFQWYMCSGILTVGLLLGTVCAGQAPATNVEGLIGGTLWAVSNMAVLPLVKLLGLGLGFALYHAVNLLTGYIVGRLGLFAIPSDGGRLPWLRDAGALALVFSFAIMVFIEPEAGQRQTIDNRGAKESASKTALKKSTRDARHGYRFSRVADEAVEEFAETADVPSRIPAQLVGARVDNPDATGTSLGLECLEPATGVPCSSTFVEEAEGGELHAMPMFEKPMVLSGLWLKFTGTVLALFAGCFAGLNAVPFDHWRLRNPAESKGSFVFPQAVGIWSMSTVMCFSNALRVRCLHKTWPPQPVLVPAFVSGCIWSVGFVWMCFAIDGLGFTAAYTFDAIGPVFVASLLSVFVFREMTSRLQLGLFGFCCFIQAIGVVLIAMGT